MNTIHSTWTHPLPRPFQSPGPSCLEQPSGLVSASTGLRFASHFALLPQMVVTAQGLGESLRVVSGLEAFLGFASATWSFYARSEKRVWGDCSRRSFSHVATFPSCFRRDLLAVWRDGYRGQAKQAVRCLFDAHCHGANDRDPKRSLGRVDRGNIDRFGAKLQEMPCSPRARCDRRILPAVLVE